MKAFRQNSFIAPLAGLLAFSTVVFFQNCSSDVGFESDPSAGRVVPVAGEPNTPNNSNGNGDPGGSGGGNGGGGTGGNGGTGGGVTVGGGNGGGGSSPTPGVGGNSFVQITFNETPQTGVNTGGTSHVDYIVSTNEGTITSVTCTLDGVNRPCGVIDRVAIADPGVGEHTFTIEATNSEGESGSETLRWTLFARIIEKTKNFSVTVARDKVDVIINVDNSGSMEFEQTSMRNRIANFIEPFKNLDYHIAITTTSPIFNTNDTEYYHERLNYVDGKFVPLDNQGTYCIKSSVHDLAKSQQLIEDNVVRDLYLRDANGNPVPYGDILLPEGDGVERGIFTTRRALERDDANQQVDNSCMRNNVAKHVVLISDEDETLTRDLTNGGTRPVNDVEKSNGANLVNYVATRYGPDTVFKFHSIIVNPYTSEGQACLGSHGYRVGTIYGQLSRDTGGYIGSVCASSYQDQLGVIGESISNSSLSEVLDCVAVPNASNSMGRVENRSNNQTIDVDYGFNGDKVEFARLLDQGNYQITYYCYE